MSTTTTNSGVIGGVDTHKHSHDASAIDVTGRLLDHRRFAATDLGHRELCAWLEALGPVLTIGVEGTSSYGTALTRVLVDRRHRVIEVNRPNRSARRNDGKSDQLDSGQAARAVLAATATAVPKSKSGAVEVLRMLRVARSTAVKSRTQAFNALHAIAVGAPQPLRDELLALTKCAFVNRCARLRPETTSMLELLHEPERLLVAGTKTSLRDLAERYKLLDAEVKRLSKTITDLVSAVAPDLVSLIEVGPEIAGQLLMTAGDNPERLSNEAAFAKLCGVAPQPASSGKTTGRHRLSRGRGPGCQQRPLHRRSHPDATPRAHPQLRRTTHGRRSQHQTSPRPESSLPQLDEHRSIERFQQTMKNWLRAQARQPTTVAELQTLLDQFNTEYNTHRPHRSLAHRATPTTAYAARPRAGPSTDTPAATHDRARTDRIDNTGCVTLRVDGHLRHIGVGRTYARTDVVLLVRISTSASSSPPPESSCEN